ncbi:pseudaminic acid cytidylyltransferase [Mesohalobacter halotolerans]|uniref:Pseudaminic acid cytidylyltransferase n=1 Tax=Mesohalobacter halotolerans TaxID=1883405 RepID=A0A4U5TS12_9FLAO|nr:pseudaminic acid cytidylyltransferase [Mesohalobacter halotolerans]TKS57069.1 pseudaminic acid cytidylyltransferase [Mesohalobacter halotolerans]
MSFTPKNICIIPARSGSKRIPRKNIKEFLGKPIIAYSIEAAIHSQLFDEVMVSTDDEEIAEVAKHYGAKVPFLRSSKNADDYATTVDVLIEVLNEYKSIGKAFDLSCCIYPTAPLVKLENLKEGHQKIKESHFDVVFPVVKFSYPIWRAFKKDKDKFKMLWSEHQQSRSQDLEEAYHDAGQWYWFRPQRLLKHKTLFNDNTSCVVLKETEVQDIDNETDWKLAELKYELL